eukprot:5419974-Amphidinium_carterae.1
MGYESLRIHSIAAPQFRSAALLNQPGNPLRWIYCLSEAPCVVSRVKQWQEASRNPTELKSVGQASCPLSVARISCSTCATSTTSCGQVNQRPKAFES